MDRRGSARAMSAPALQFKLPKEAELRETVIARAVAQLRRLPDGKAFVLKVEELRPKRSEQQNRYLWGVCYAELLKVLPGWDSDDVHEYMLGECFGWEVMEGMGRK